MINKDINHWITLRAYCSRTNKIYDVYSMSNAIESADLYTIEDGQPAFLDREVLYNSNNEPDLIFLRKTDRKAANGEWIYDGDLLKQDDSEIVECAHWDCINGCFILGRKPLYEVLSNQNTYSIIGNINTDRDRLKVVTNLK